VITFANANILQTITARSIFVKANILPGDTPMTDRRLDSLETLFRALADRTRLRIVSLLLSGEVCVCDIHESLGLPQPTVSRHLAYLRHAGLVVSRKDGLWVHYRLADLPDPVVKTLLDAVGHALGHLESGKRDHKRLAAQVDVPARRWIPLEHAPCCGRSTPR
jgi:ArsR family transcriptional regulator, arsenate/arsenite/antimonite-responsive transcriptional repressor